MKWNLELRHCKCPCRKPFRVLAKSEQRYWSRWHELGILPRFLEFNAYVEVSDDKKGVPDEPIDDGVDDLSDLDLTDHERDAG